MGRITRIIISNDAPRRACRRRVVKFRRLPARTDASSSTSSARPSPVGGRLVRALALLVLLAGGCKSLREQPEVHLPDGAAAPPADGPTVDHPAAPTPDAPLAPGGDGPMPDGPAGQTPAP